MVRAIPSAGRVREPTAGMGFHAGKGLRIPPLSVKLYTVSGRGRGADDAPARLHQTPLSPEGRAVRPGLIYAARSVQGASPVTRRYLAFIRVTSGFDRAQK